jgi:hypothetical protein
MERESERERERERERNHMYWDITQILLSIGFASQLFTLGMGMGMPIVTSIFCKFVSNL